MAVYRSEKGTNERAALMCRAQEGDQLAYRALLQAILPMLQGYFRKRLKTEQDVDDLVQKVLLRLHMYRASFSGQENFDGWMYTIARHTLFDILDDREESTKQEFEEEMESAPGDPEIGLAVRQALESLPDESRQAVILTKIEGLEIKEAAEKLQVTESAMKVRVHRAMKSLRKNLWVKNDG